MSTKRSLAEQVLRNLTGGNPSAGSRWDLREIEMAIGQNISSKLKVSHFQETMVAGETIPEGLKIAVYDDNIVPVPYKGKSKVTLPAIPVSLPRNMGIFHVGPKDDPHCGYIPLMTGQYAQVSKLVGMSDMLGQVSYEPREKELLFSKDISGTELMILLVIMDINKYDEFSPLPIPQDMENQVVLEVTEAFMGRGEPNKIVESNTAK
jgi:hypothetical protein